MDKDLAQHMQLNPIEADSLIFSEFLSRLQESPEIADTAAAVLLRAIKKRGLVEIDKQPTKRRHYLEALARMRVPAYQAFDHVRGSHLTVHKIVRHLEAASANGYQLRQALVLIGWPGCGKTYLVDAIKNVLEGELIYVVEGCPVQENPINLLKLLNPVQVTDLAEALGMNDPEKGTTLQSLLAVAGDPCDHCWRKVMCNDEHNEQGLEFNKEPNLGLVQIKQMRLSSRLFGIATWSQTEDGPTLLDAIRQGCGGIVDLPEMFAVQEADLGKTLQIEALIDATDGRRIANTQQSHSRSGYLPVNVVIIGQSNQGSYDKFRDSHADPDKFTRRTNVLSIPYITARVEEEAVYQEYVERLKRVPHFDPNALSLAATLAVGSRLKVILGLSPIHRVRLNDGEVFPVPKSGGNNTWEPEELNTALAALSQGDEKESIGNREGMTGLNLPFMLSFLGLAIEGTLQGPKSPVFKDEPHCITAIQMIAALRNRLEAHSMMNGITADEKKVAQRCLTDWLKRPDTIGAEPGLLEKEYRRLLRQEILTAFAPDFETRAKDLFKRYRLHARAFANGDSKVKLPQSTKEVEVDTNLLKQIDHDKSLKPGVFSNATSYRGSIDAQLVNLTHSTGTLQSEDDENVQIDWKTLPELKQAIEDFLNAEIAEKVNRILTKQYDLLNDDDKAAFDAAFSSFQQHGYCKVCFKQAMEYAEELKLWAKPQGG